MRNRSVALLRSASWLAAAAIAIAAPAPAGAGQAAPTLSITSVPDYGALGSIAGRVEGLDPATHHVAGYLYADGYGWCTKPSFASPTVPIVPDTGTPDPDDGTFTLDVTTGGAQSLDPSAVLYCAAVLHADESPPPVCGVVRIPAFTPLAQTCVARFGREIAFAGRSWGVKQSSSPVGPGQNWFSLAPDDVFVDAGGKLHLTIRPSDDHWSATEVELLEPLGYGTYEFTTESDLASLDANATFGAFTWDPFGDEDGADRVANREIDFEVSRWGEAGDPTNAQAVVQPFAVPGNLERFTIPSGVLRWRITWSPGRVDFEVRDAASQLYAWSYVGPAVPTPGRAMFHLNLWLNDVELGGPPPPHPAGAAPIEVVVGSFEYTPEPAATACGLAVVAPLALLARARRRRRGAVC